MSRLCRDRCRPSAQLLQEHRDRVFLWAAGQMIVVIAVVATGAGLHVAAYFIEHKARISVLATVLSVVTPIGVLGVLYAVYLKVRRSVVTAAGG